ncbi:MAG: dTDP-4-dehydrorhamnose 3,5-epimerase [Bacteroidia bacterium]|nr:dTDP-4-dehydrorhamnose 3,5-epimerase [Bacteroidia bacterium]
MKIDLINEALNGLKVFEPEVYEDERGFFCEVYRKDHFTAAGITDEFVQDNHSKSARGVVRGLHFQWEPPMAKLMRVTQGEAFLVAVDIRIGSPSFGKWHGEFVSDKNRRLVYAPAGFARGFGVISETAEIQYKCTGIYNKNAEAGILWNDPAIGIEWPIIEPTLSAKDKVAPTLSEWLNDPRSKHFTY